MRILVVGAGVIGSIYAGKLTQAGHQVALLARGQRRLDLQAHGLLLGDAQSGERIELPVPALGELDTDERYDLVLVSVRCEQLSSTLPILLAMNDDSDILFFGNTAGHQAQLVATFGDRALFGFPAAGGVLVGPLVRYVTIPQQKTMLGEADGVTTPRLLRLQRVLTDAGFPTRVSAEIDDWMIGHTAFVVPIGLALQRLGTDSATLAADAPAVKLMVRATREAFRALRAQGNTQIPTNLRILYLCLPQAFAVCYWRRVLAGPRGELWFGAHSRAAPEETHTLARELEAAVRDARRPTPHLDILLSNSAS